MDIKKFLEAAFPDVDKELVEEFSEGISKYIPSSQVLADSTQDKLKIEDLEGEVISLRNEVSRLNTVIVNQRAGYENASPAALGILAERARQKRMEGYNEEHDDEHDMGELAKAALCYLLDAIERAEGKEGYSRPPTMWPWEVSEWKRKPVHRQMEIAGALIIAEQERRKRNGLESV